MKRYQIKASTAKFCTNLAGLGSITFILFFGSCRKLIQVDTPITQIASATIYSGNGTAAAAMTGIYIQMENDNTSLSDGQTSISYLESLASDELTNYSSTAKLVQFYENALKSANGSSSNEYYWQELYEEIYSCNAVLSGLAASTGVTAPMKQQLTGEAKFMRAFLYFYATNLYGDVPLATTPLYTTNEVLPRSPKAVVYQQIIQDLKDAENALGSNYLDQNGNTTGDKIRPNKWAASALLARTYLYAAKWDSAAIEATKVINSGSYSLPTDLTQVFLGNSTEAILQFYPVNSEYNTLIAQYFVLTSKPGTGRFAVGLSPYLKNAFEPGDQRFKYWVGSFTTGGITYYYPFKYKVYQTNQPVTEFNMLLRFAEQYLIRAEAESQLSADQTAAITDLNVVRNRAGLPNYAGAATPVAVQAAILHERQVELFTEWGHRWFDLVRTNNINSVMGSPGNVCSAKNGTWNTEWELVPLPLSELQDDHNLTQNPGY